jgi:hypothetical protein
MAVAKRERERERERGRERNTQVLPEKVQVLGYLNPLY